MLSGRRAGGCQARCKLHGLYRPIDRLIAGAGVAKRRLDGKVHRWKVLDVWNDPHMGWATGQPLIQHLASKTACALQPGPRDEVLGVFQVWN